MPQLKLSGKQFVRPLGMDSLHTTEECDLKTTVFKFSHYQTLITMNNFPLLLRITKRNHNQVTIKQNTLARLPEAQPILGTFYAIKVLGRSDEQSSSFLDSLFDFNFKESISRTQHSILFGIQVINYYFFLLHLQT